MANIGEIIVDKYEILKQIGKGGMSTVYLAMDKNLNKQWAVKEILKEESNDKDEIVVNSLLAEAHLMKRLDHPALPRIVDIIDDKENDTLFVVMDYIEGESLDNVLKAEGPQSEETVINWAKQLCDALGYLHSQKPPIVYRDMKPANVMLKPEGNIKIIDFGIAREYKDQKLQDTTVLGTKGYAPPEQYSGQTDARSDIYALGMTMHHLLTGVDPRAGDAYVPVRQWNPELSEGIEAIIDKCVQPAAENRYQTCADLLYDLDHPDLITQGYKKKQKMKLGSFIAAACVCVVMAIAGIGCKYASTYINNSDYDVKVNGSNPVEYYKAIDIYPGRIDAYNRLIEYYNNYSVSDDDANKDEKNEEKYNAIKKIGNTIDKNVNALDQNHSEVAELYYNMGRLYFTEGSGNFKSRAVDAKKYFEIAVNSEAYFEKKELARCYYSICKFMENQKTSHEPALKEYNELFEEINNGLKIVKKADDGDSNYDKISFYHVTMLLINDQSEYMAGVGFDKQTALNMMQELYNDSAKITSALSYVNGLKEKINSNYSTYIEQLNSKYNEVEKRQQGDFVANENGGND